MLSVTYVPISSLKPHPGNPKDHDLTSLIKSIERFGYRIPIDHSNKDVLAGHGRLEALQRMKVEYAALNKPPPAGITVVNGEWWVPVLEGAEKLSPEEAEAFILADNQVQMNGQMKASELKAMMARVSKSAQGLIGTGFLEKIGEKAKEALAKPPEMPQTGASGGQGEPEERTPIPTFSGTGIKPLLFMLSEDMHLKVSATLETIVRREALIDPKGALVYLLNLYLAQNGEESI